MLKPFALLVVAAITGALTPAVTAVVGNPVASGDFSGALFTTTPDMFGANHFNSADALTLAPKIVRNDFESHSNSVSNPVVPVTTISAYKAALAEGCMAETVCDPGTWNFKASAVLSNLMTAHAAGVRTLGIMDEWSNPSWNSWNGSGNGVPKDWDVYEDIVKKFLLYFTPDMIEIWNEPDYYESLDITGSPYATPQKAYDDIYYHTAHAIRILAGKTDVSLGGPTVCCANPDLASYFSPVWNDSRIPHSWVNFLSYHNYYPGNGFETAFGMDVKSYLQGLQANIPIYLTEWNYDANCAAVPGNYDDPATVGFWGDRLLSAMNAHFTGALFFANEAHTAGQTYGCRTMDGNNKLLPKTRVFALMQADMGLGAGDFQLVPTSVSAHVTAAQGAINSAGKAVMMAANYAASPVTIDVIFSGLKISGSHTVFVYLVDHDLNTGERPIYSGRQTISGGIYSQSVTMTANSVVGVLIN